MTDRHPAIDEVVLVQTEDGLMFQAALRIVEGDEPPVWVADEWGFGLHPPCWSDGQCWAANEDGEPSTPVRRWWRLPLDGAVKIAADTAPLTRSTVEQARRQALRAWWEILDHWADLVGFLGGAVMVLAGLGAATAVGRVIHEEIYAWLTS